MHADIHCVIEGVMGLLLILTTSLILSTTCIITVYKLKTASAKVLTETTGLGSTQEPQTATELRELEISKLRLEIDVLTLKRKLLPLQIGRHKRLRALSRQSPLEVEESGSDRVQ